MIIRTKRTRKITTARKANSGGKNRKYKNRSINPVFTWPPLTVRLDVFHPACLVHWHISSVEREYTSPLLDMARHKFCFQHFFDSAIRCSPDHIIADNASLHQILQLCLYSWVLYYFLFCLLLSRWWKLFHHWCDNNYHPLLSQCHKNTWELPNAISNRPNNSL